MNRQSHFCQRFQNTLHLFALGIRNCNDHFIQGRAFTVIDQIICPSYDRHSADLAIFRFLAQKCQSAELIAVILKIFHIHDERHCEHIVRNQQRLPALPKNPIQRRQTFFPELVHNQHQDTVNQKKIEEHQTRVSIQQSHKIQYNRRARKTDCIIANHTHAFMQRSPQHHVPVQAAKQVHCQKNDKHCSEQKAEIHPGIIALKQPTISNIVCQNQAHDNRQTVQQQNHQILQIRSSLIHFYSPSI